MTENSLPGVSRETNDRLRIFAELLRKWNTKINLVSRVSLDALWTRHIVDSAQLFSLLPQRSQKWVDIGTGGGLPGIVVAILAQEAEMPAEVILVESDQRKCAFLRTALRETGCAGHVIAGRIEEQPPFGTAVLSARALADLDTLLTYTDRHMDPDGIALFPKGETWQDEVLKAQSKWQFDLDVVKSKTNPAAAILKISGVSRV